MGEEHRRDDKGAFASLPSLSQNWEREGPQGEGEGSWFFPPYGD